MCWYSSLTPKLKVSKRDIKVKKILAVSPSLILTSPIFTKQKWESGEQIESDIEKLKFIKDANIYYINHGIHSCKNIKVINDIWYVITDSLQKRLWIKYDREVLCEAIIPKGSQYYVNEYGEYVSNKLICYF